MYLLRGAQSISSPKHYEVDLIDPWLMEVHPLGFTGSGLQVFDSPMAPCLLRFVRADGGHVTDAAPVQTLYARFLNDPSISKPPVAVAIQRPMQHYSQEYTIGELLDNPQTSALVKKYLTLPPIGFVRALYNFGDVCGLVRELEMTPVGP